MTKKVLISLDDIEDIIQWKAEHVKDISYILSRVNDAFRKWFDAQEDLEPTLSAIDDMDLWDDIEYYIREIEDEKSTD